MSISNVKDSLKRSIAAFNEKRLTLPAVFVDDHVHSADWQQEQIKLGREKLRKEYFLDALSVQAKLNQEVKETVLKIGKIKFPKATDYSDATRILGETQNNNAQLFLMQPHSNESILLSIKNAFALGRIDYAFCLIGGMQERLKPKNELEQFNQPEADKVLLAQIDTLVSQFDGKGELATMSEELESVPEVSRTAQAFQKFLSNENVTTSFIPMWDIKGMSQADMTRIGVESINASMFLQPEESTT